MKPGPFKAQRQAIGNALMNAVIYPSILLMLAINGAAYIILVMVGLGPTQPIAGHED